MAKSIPGLPYRLQIRALAGPSPLSTTSLPLQAIRRLEGVLGLSSKDTCFRLLINLLVSTWALGMEAKRNPFRFKENFFIKTDKQYANFLVLSHFFPSLSCRWYTQFPCSYNCLFHAADHRESKWKPGKVQFYAANYLDCFVHWGTLADIRQPVSLSQYFRSALVSVDLSGLK